MTLDELRALMSEGGEGAEEEAVQRDWIARFTTAFSEWELCEIGALFLSAGMMLSHLGDDGMAHLNEAVWEMMILLAGDPAHQEMMRQLGLGNN